MNKFWKYCRASLENELTPQQYQTWIRPLIPVSFDAELNRLSIAAPNRLKLDWVKNQFSGRISHLACEFWKRSIDVIFVLDSTLVCPSMDVLTSKSDNTSLSKADSNDLNICFNKSVKTLRIENVNSRKSLLNHNIFSSSFMVDRNKPTTLNKSKLNLALTFENFVTGKANQLARAAGIQVANKPGISYNPLFLYGGIGLGKTHLIHAIGNQMLLDNPNPKIRYIHAEQYVSDVVKAYQRKAFDEFKRYYHLLDFLLIDDIQFFSQKSRTQEEFFYAFEALMANKAQVIITSDSYPKEISGIDDRLISRFDSGLTVAIEPPELEMRVAILISKAKSEKQVFSEDVAFFVAKHLRSNVRELEGALRKILAYSQFHGREITIELTKEALKDLLVIRNRKISIDNRKISTENIQKIVADFYNIKATDMYSKKRSANIARARQIAMYLTKELTQKSMLEIGDLFGHRDHTTVLYAIKKISNERREVKQLNHELHMLEQALKN